VVTDICIMLRHRGWNGIIDEWRQNIVLNELKFYIYSLHFTINLLGNDVSHQFTIAIYLGYLTVSIILYKYV